MTEQKLQYIDKKISSKLQTKDYITLGLYTLLIILLMAVGVGVLAAVFSILFSGKYYFAAFTTIATALFAAPAYTLIFHKINKKYAIFITTFILGLFLGLSGHALITFFFTVLGGVAAEYFFRKNNEYLSYLFYTLGSISAIIPMYFMKKNYIEHLHARGYSEEKINFIMSQTSIEVFIIILVLTIIFSFLGTYIGRKIYFRNFDKAGL